MTDTADTLIYNFIIKPNTLGSDSLLMSDENIFLLTRDDNYIKTKVLLLGRENGPSRFLSTDTLKGKISFMVEYLINEPDSSRVD